MITDALSDVEMDMEDMPADDSEAAVMPDASALMVDDNSEVIGDEAGESRRSAKTYGAPDYYPSHYSSDSHGSSYYDPYGSPSHTGCSCSSDCPYCDSYGGEDAYYSHCDHKCSCMEAPSLADIHILKPCGGHHGGDNERITNHRDNIEVACHSADLLPQTSANEVVAENNCGCAVQCSKQCGSGYSTRTFSIHGSISVDESVEHHQKSGEKTCLDGRSYKCSDCMQHCGGGECHDCHPHPYEGRDFFVGEEDEGIEVGAAASDATVSSDAAEADTEISGNVATPPSGLIMPSAGIPSP